MLALARHDAGLVALAAGPHPRGRRPARRRARRPGRREPAGRPAGRAPRRWPSAGDADEAAAELRRADARAGRAGRPGVGAGAADGPGAGPGRAGARRPRRGAAPACRVGRRVAPPRGRRGRAVGDEYMAALVDLGRPPVVGLVEPDRELARVTAELARAGGRDARVHADRPRRPRRSRRCGSCCSTPPASPSGGPASRRSRRAPPGEYTIWHDGYPDFPMPQRLRADHRAGRVVDVLPGLRHRLHLAARRARRRHAAITVTVDLPDREAHRLDGQRASITTSLAALARLAEARQ